MQYVQWWRGIATNTRQFHMSCKSSGWNALPKRYGRQSGAPKTILMPSLARKIGFFQQDLSGKTSLVTVWDDKEDSGDKLWNYISHSTSFKRPTRFVLIASKQVAAQVLSKSNQVLELAQIPQGLSFPRVRCAQDEGAFVRH